MKKSRSQMVSNQKPQARSEKAPMRYLLVGILGLAQASCQQKSDSDHSHIVDLENRVQALEQHSPSAHASPLGKSSTEQMNYELIGLKDSLQYPSLARCEAGKQALISSYAAADADGHERDMVFNRAVPTLTCVPL